MVRDIFAVVDPEQSQAYGHRIRQLLILSCMEVENACRGILEANQFEYEARRSSTKDYWIVTKPLRRQAYSLRLVEYPAVSAFRPFSGWSEHRPTKSIPWYDAYNRRKHSRVQHFRDATLGASLTALGGAWVLHAGQFGPKSLAEDGSPFTGRYPGFSTEQGYLSGIIGGGSKEVPYPLT